MTAQSPDDRKQKLADDIAFGVEQTLACWATDFIDPIVGAKLQKKLEPHVKEGKESKNAWIGEIAGDTAALFIFLGVQRFLPTVTQGLKHIAAFALDPFYDKTGRAHLKSWARQEHVAVDSPEYQKKLHEWKDHQAETLAKSSVVAGSSTVVNIVVQKKLLGSPHSWFAVTAAKILGAVITMGVMLVPRFTIPKQMQKLDDTLSDKVFSPLIGQAQELAGVRGKGPIRTEHTHGSPVHGLGPGEDDMPVRDKTHVGRISEKEAAGNLLLRG